MLQYTIKSKPVITSKPHFFIQSHGLHAGRPLRDPIPNCFTVILENDQLVHTAFYTCKMLYQSRSFERIIRGSVIPFIALYECKKVYAEGVATTMKNPIRFTQISSALDKIETKIKLNLQENKTLLELELSLLAEYRK